MSEGQPPGKQEPITPESVIEVQKQTEALYVGKMNEWEASVREKGPFFIPLGRKDDDTIPYAIHPDTRALILIEGIPMETISDAEKDKLKLEIPTFLKRNHPVTDTAPKKRYAVLTRKGPKVMDLTNEEYVSLSSLGPNEKSGFSDGTNTIQWGQNTSSVSDLPNDEAGDELFNEALTKSREASREKSENAKNKAALDAARQELDRAQRLLGSSGTPPQPQPPTDKPWEPPGWSKEE